MHTHSKDRIQQPRAMPSRILRVRRSLPDNTWVVLSQTRSTIEKPPSVVTTWATVCCFLQKLRRAESIQTITQQSFLPACSPMHKKCWKQSTLKTKVCTHSVGMLVMTSVLIVCNKRNDRDKDQYWTVQRTLCELNVTVKKLDKGCKSKNKDWNQLHHYSLCLLLSHRFYFWEVVLIITVLSENLMWQTIWW